MLHTDKERPAGRPTDAVDRKVACALTAWFRAHNNLTNALNKEREAWRDLCAAREAPFLAQEGNNK